MARDNYMDDEAAPATAEDDPMADSEEKSDETDDQLALVPSHFFKNQPPKPGQRETVEIVQVYENECSIKCVYSEDDDEDEEEDGSEEYAEAPAEPEDEMMA
jgi:hypothetical protein